MAALSSADTGLGASGCARGSHACRGSSPALEPNPIRVNTNTVWRTRSGSVPIPPKSSPAWAASTTIPNSSETKPNWVITA
nr:hypothetical protein CPGR_01290 [Mycolicibacter nonchromogenicus]